MPRQFFIALGVVGALAGCDSGGGEPTGEQSIVEQDKVETSGKTPVDIANVPAPVLEAVRSSEPNLGITAASSETRDGRTYYDIEGTLPDGSELELDLMHAGEGWRVVETQRDIELAEAPATVRAELERAPNSFAPARIIESRQNDGLIIYEFFEKAGQGTDGRKLEVKFDGSEAELLANEWLH